MITIKDIAVKTGYSISTVSKALKNSSRISKRARKIINATAQELHYVPNASARNLSMGRTKNIGIMIPYMQKNTYYDTLIISIISECFKLNFQPTFLVTNYNQNIEKRHLKQFAAHSYDGLIITTSSSNYKFYKQYLELNRRIISLEINDNIPYISMNRSKGINLAMKYAIQKRKSNFAATFSRTPKSGEGANIAFTTISKYDSNFNERKTFSHCKKYEDGLKAGKYFNNLTDKIDCILANSDDVAAGIIKYYEQNHLPQPLIIGENNSSLSQFLEIPSLDYHLNTMGKRAVRWVCHIDNSLKVVEPTLQLH